MYVCMYVCMYVYMYVHTSSAWKVKDLGKSRMYVCMYVRIYVCAYLIRMEGKGFIHEPCNESIRNNHEAKHNRSSNFVTFALRTQRCSDGLCQAEELYVCMYVCMYVYIHMRTTFALRTQRCSDGLHQAEELCTYKYCVSTCRVAVGKNHSNSLCILSKCAYVEECNAQKVSYISWCSESESESESDVCMCVCGRV